MCVSPGFSSFSSAKCLRIVRLSLSFYTPAQLEYDGCKKPDASPAHPHLSYVACVRRKLSSLCVCCDALRSRTTGHQAYFYFTLLLLLPLPCQRRRLCALLLCACVRKRTYSSFPFFCFSFSFPCLNFFSRR